MKKKKIILLLLLGVALVCVVVGAVLLFFRQPKKIFIDHLQKMSNVVFDTLENRENELTTFLDQQDKWKMTSKTVLTFDDSLQLEPLTIDSAYQTDKTENKQQLNFDLAGATERLLGLDFYVEDDQFYYRIQDAMEQFYFTTLDLSSLENQSLIDDYHYLFDLLLPCLKKNISNDFFEEIKGTLEINDEELQVKKIRLKVDQELLNQIMIDYLDVIINDEKALQIVSDLSQQEAQEMKDELSSYLEQIKQDTSDTSEVLFTYEFALKNNQVISQVFEQDDAKITYQYYEKIATLIYTMQDNDMMRLTIEKDQDTYRLSGSIMGVYTISGTYQNASDSKVLDLSVSSSVGQDVFALYLKDSKLEKTEERYRQEMEGTVTITGMQFAINVQNEYQKVDTLDWVDTSNSIDQESLSEEEKDALLESFLNIPLVQLLPLFTTQPYGVGM